MAKTLIKIDRNGTKHYRVDECPRCGGTGKYEYTTLDNYRCWKCGGSGYYPHIEKEYTEEYLAKKEAKAREKKLADNLAKLPENIKKMTPFLSMEKPIYVVKGNTFKIRNELKEKGARFSQQLRTWVFDTPTDEYETLEIRFDDIWFINKFNRPESKYTAFWEIFDKLK